MNVATIFPARELNSYVMPFYRYLFGTLFLLPIFLRKGFISPMRTGRIGQHAFRGALHSIGMLFWFIALSRVTLADLTALGFMGPIFVTFGAALFLGEDVRLRRWIAVFVGFIGAMLIVRPGFAELSLGVMAALISTPLFATSNAMSKVIGRTDSADTIVIWQSIFIVLFAAPMAIMFWEWPTWGHVGWFLIAGLLGTIGQLFMQHGYQVAEISAVQPIGFLSLIWNTAFGFLLFSQQPSTWTFIGAAVIFSSTMYISHREAVRQAQLRTGAAVAKP
jgi:drug/metabolite transporter (DMT)-like permease